VLQAFSSRRHTRTARELAELTAIPLPSLYRYLALLRDTGLVVGDERGAYRLSPRLIALGRAAEAAEPMIAAADPVMRELAAECGEMVLLVRLVARVPVCVHVAGPAPSGLAPSGVAQSGVHAVEPGQELPLLRGASGWVLLAGRPDRQRRECLAPLAREEPSGAARLEETIARVVDRGWAVSEEEAGAAVWTASAAVTAGPVTVAALTVPAPQPLAAALRERLVGQVRAAAARLSQQLAEGKLS
jgi:DNA-binding IclR family transcriptional regulator